MMNEAKKVLRRSNNHQIVSVYNRRFLVQSYNPFTGRWETKYIFDNEHDANMWYERKGY